MTLAQAGVAQPEGASPRIKRWTRGSWQAMRPDDAIITVDHVTYRYPNALKGAAPALDDVSLAIPRGAFVGLVGRNGSGKTTLVRHFDGLLRPQSGTVQVDGMDVSSHSVGGMARHVGFVFQNPDHQIFCSTVRDEIGYGPRALGVPRTRWGSGWILCSKPCR